MTEREKFIQWARMEPRCYDCERWPEDGMGLSGEFKCWSTQKMFEAWQAATDASTHKAIYEDEV